MDCDKQVMAGPKYYNKNKWVSDHSVEIVWIVFM